MPEVDTPAQGQAIVVYDGLCNLCSATVRFVIRRDPPGFFRFAALQSEAGHKWLASYTLPAGVAGNLVLLVDGRAYTHSEACVRIAQHLRFPWPALGAMLRLVPRRLRDAGYDWVARHRYRWFGRKERCEIPPEENRARFL